jgi:hypothetical protein
MHLQLSGAGKLTIGDRDNAQAEVFQVQCSQPSNNTDGFVELAFVDGDSTSGNTRSIRLTTTQTGLRTYGTIVNGGNINPYADSTSDLGTNTVRWANVYADTLYGDGSNITSVAATTAATLATARNIAGVAFDGSANISLNNNAITNGAGYIDGSALNAANLSSGTIPDARFPATLPAVSGANLTNLPSTGGTVGPGNEKLFVEAENQMDASFSTTANFNYVAASPMIIASGATLTVSANSTMTFV